MLVSGIFTIIGEIGGPPTPSEIQMSQFIRILDMTFVNEFIHFLSS